jgi:hypothetical protein
MFARRARRAIRVAWRNATTCGLLRRSDPFFTPLLERAAVQFTQAFFDRVVRFHPSFKTSLLVNRQLDNTRRGREAGGQPGILR